MINLGQSWRAHSCVPRTRRGSTVAKHCQTSPPPRPWVSPSTALIGDRPGHGDSCVCPRPTGTTSLSRLTIIESRLRGIPSSCDGYPSVIGQLRLALAMARCRDQLVMVLSRCYAQVHKWRCNSPDPATFVAECGEKPPTSAADRIERDQSRALSAATSRCLAACEGRP